MKMMKSVVLTEKPDQAHEVKAAVGGSYGRVVAAAGHLLVLEEPADVNPEWKSWGFSTLWPGSFYGNKPDLLSWKKKKLKEIGAALRGADRLIIATDCDREGQLIAEELISYFKFKGKVMRAIFTGLDKKTLQDAFANIKPNRDYANLGAAAAARQQADQVYNLSMTRAATLSLGDGPGVIGVGRVKTPTLAIVCRREKEIAGFVAKDYFEVVATADFSGEAGSGAFEMRHAPAKDRRITSRDRAAVIAGLAKEFSGPAKVQVEEKTQRPPPLYDLTSLQTAAGSRWGWTAARTLEVAQSLYEKHKLTTYAAVESHYLEENQIADVPRILAGLATLPAFKAAPAAPIIRKGKTGNFCDACLAGVSHHAIIPNANTMDRLPGAWDKLTRDESLLFGHIAAAYVAAMMPDYKYMATTVSLNVVGNAGPYLFQARGHVPLVEGWKKIRGATNDKKKKGEGALPPIEDGEILRLSAARVEAKKTQPPPRYNEGSLIKAMREAWRFIADAALRDRLKEAEGIGRPRTRAIIVAGLKRQGFLAGRGKNIVPTAAGMKLFDVLGVIAPKLVDPGVTAVWERRLDEILTGKATALDIVEEIVAETRILVDIFESGKGRYRISPTAGGKSGGGKKWGTTGKRRRRRKRKPL